MRDKIPLLIISILVIASGCSGPFQEASPTETIPHSGELSGEYLQIKSLSVSENGSQHRTSGAVFSTLRNTTIQEATICLYAANESVIAASPIGSISPGDREQFDVETGQRPYYITVYDASIPDEASVSMWVYEERDSGGVYSQQYVSREGNSEVPYPSSNQEGCCR